MASPTTGTDPSASAKESALCERCVTLLRTRGWHDAAQAFASWLAAAGDALPPELSAALLDARRRNDPLRAADLLEGRSPRACKDAAPRDRHGRQIASAVDPEAEAVLQEETAGALHTQRVVLGAATCPLALRWAATEGIDFWHTDPSDPGAAAPAGAKTLRPDALPAPDATIWIHPALAGDAREVALAWRARIRGQGSHVAAPDGLRAVVVVGPRPFHVEAPLVETLRALGVGTAVVQVHGDARDDEVADAVARAAPDRVISVNGAGLVRSPALRAALAALEIPTVLWFVDEPDAALGDARGRLAAPHVLALAWEREAVARLRRHGFQGAAFLPHGTRWTRRVPPVAGAGDLLWIGTSYAGDDRRALHAGAHGPLPPAWREAAGRLRNDPRISLAGLREQMADDDATARVRQVVLGDAVASERRGTVARALLPLGLRIYGDADGWTRLLGRRQAICPDVDASTGFPHLVGGSRISVDCVHPQMPTAVTQRVFDVPACGGLVLADDRADLREHFDVGHEVLAYTEPAHAAELARWALDRPAARDRIAEAAHRRVLAEHTLVHRMRRLLRLADAHFGR